MAKDATVDFRLSLLGSFCVEVANREVPMESWKSKKALMLFKYLAHRCGEKIPNDMLIDLLWPDSDFDSASHNLHTTIYFLRKTLKEADERDVSTRIRFANGLYWFELEDGDFLDTVQFRVLCRRNEELKERDPQTALQAGLDGLKLYRGDFLAEEMYADWTVSPREHYREQYMELSLRTSRLLVEHNQDFKQAIRICRAALNHDPYREELHQAVIGYLINSRRYPEATIQFKTCAKILQDEFGLEPSEETKTLLRQIKDHANAKCITGELKSTPSNGALVCDRSAFQSILQLEKGRLERNERPVTLITISLGDRVALREQARKALQILGKTLRKGDATCQWSDSVIAVLLANTNETGAGVVLRRLKRSMDQAGAGNCSLKQYILSDSLHDVTTDLVGTLSQSTS